MLIGDRIVVRPVENEDIPTIFQWSSDYELKELFDFRVAFLNKDELCSEVEKYRTDERTIDLCIADKSSKRIVGRCVLTEVDFINKKANCFLYIGEQEFIGKGYGTEALHIIMDYAFNKLNLNRLESYVFDFNKKAIKCYKRCGLKVEGIIREGVYRRGKYHDIYIMGILKCEYEEMTDGGDIA